MHVPTGVLHFKSEEKQASFVRAYVDLACELWRVRHDASMHFVLLPVRKPLLDRKISKRVFLCSVFTHEHYLDDREHHFLDGLR